MISPPEVEYAVRVFSVARVVSISTSESLTYRTVSPSTISPVRHTEEISLTVKLSTVTSSLALKLAPSEQGDAKVNR